MSLVVPANCKPHPKTIHTITVYISPGFSLMQVPDCPPVADTQPGKSLPLNRAYQKGCYTNAICQIAEPPESYDN